MAEDKTQFDELDARIREAASQSNVKLPDDAPPVSPEHKKRLVQKSASAGLEFAAAIIIATFIGIWLDRQFDTAPLFMLLLLVLGTCTAFYNLYRSAQNLSARKKDEDSQLPDE